MFLGIYSDPNYIAHHGVKGMKWGVRRYQNKDGSLTPEGRKQIRKHRRGISDINLVQDSFNRLVSKQELNELSKKQSEWLSLVRKSRGELSPDRKQELKNKCSEFYKDYERIVNKAVSTYGSEKGYDDRRYIDLADDWLSDFLYTGNPRDPNHSIALMDYYLSDQWLH